METAVLESLFDKIVGLQIWNFIRKRIRNKCFPVNITKFLRTVFYRTPPVMVSEDIELIY